jgi:site-specific DNA recombinase
VREVAEMRKAVLYLRCSTDKQEYSIEVQEKVCRRYAKKVGYDIVRLYVDRGISGTSMKNRKEFQQMVSDAKQPGRTFEAIIAYDRSRFGRADMDEVGYYLYVIREAGVEVLFANGSNDDDEYLDFHNARKEAKLASSRTLDNQIERMGHGEYVGGMPPYGYDLQYCDETGDPSIRVRYVPSGRGVWSREIVDAGGKLVMTLTGKNRRAPVEQGHKCELALGDSTKIEVVRRIFDLYVTQGHGFRRITEALNLERIPAPAGGTWSVSAVRSIITNPGYTGDLVWNRRTFAKFHSVRNGELRNRPRRERQKHSTNSQDDWLTARARHPVIIDRATFIEAQHILQRRSNSRGTDAYRHGRAMNSDFLLSGTMRCSRCGHSLIGETIWSSKVRKNGTRIKTQYYVCSGYKNKGNSVCQRSPIRVEIIHAFVLERIGTQVEALLSSGGSKALRDLVVKELESGQPDTQHERQTAQKDLASVETKIERLVNALATMDSANRQVINEKLTSLVEQRDSLKARLKELEPVQHKEVDCDAIADQIVASVRGFDDLFSHGTPEEKKEFIRLWLDGIDFDPEERRARVYMKRFPAPSPDTGNSSLSLVAGASYPNQKRSFPPIDAIDIQLEHQGKALVSAGV